MQKNSLVKNGTTALACKQTNRRYIGSEIGNIDVSNNRLNKIEIKFDLNGK